MQGTIKHYDEAGHTGALLTDDKTEIVIDERSVGDSRIRMLRIGQRVRFDVETMDGGVGVARDLHLVTF